jgi:23S rRNA (guanosine2251-2'-O)-methyltransferase
MAYNRRGDDKPKDTKIYGLRPVLEALEAGQDLEKILIRKGHDSPLAHELREALKHSGIQLQEVPVQKLNKFTGTEKHQGVVAFVSPITYQPLEEIVIDLYERGETPLLLMPVGVTDVRNLGAIARSAECLGAHAILMPGGGRARVNADAIKTSAGALMHLPVCRVTHIGPSLDYLRESGVQLVGVYEEGNLSLWQAPLNGPACLIVGAEDTGIPYPIRKKCDVTVSIPMQGRIASMNVSVTAGMAMYEAMRQRTTVV